MSRPPSPARWQSWSAGLPQFPGSDIKGQGMKTTRRAAAVFLALLLSAFPSALFFAHGSQPRSCCASGACCGSKDCPMHAKQKEMPDSCPMSHDSGSSHVTRCQCHMSQGRPALAPTNRGPFIYELPQESLTLPDTFRPLDLRLSPFMEEPFIAPPDQPPRSC